MAKAKKEKPVVEETAFDKPEEVVSENKEPITEEPEVVVVETPIEPVMAAEEKVRQDAIADPTTEEKILKFIENSTGNPVKLNDFLKSLFPPLAPMTPPLWKQQIVSRQVKVMLTKMNNDGVIKIVNSRLEELGSPYFKGEEQRAAHYDLDAIAIMVEK